MSEAMNIIIAGSRDFDDYRLLKNVMRLIMVTPL